MKIEPVAWLWIHKGKVMNALLRNPDCDERNKEYWSKKGWHSEPLYTHPELTPLTEDECESIINKHDWFSKSWREMAKEIHDAILKKVKA